MAVETAGTIRGAGERLVAAAFGAAVDPSRWADVVTEIEAFSPDATAFVHLHDATGESIAVEPSRRLDDGALSAYRNTFRGLNVGKLLQDAPDGGTIHVPPRFVDEHVLPSGLFNDWQLPLGAGLVASGIKLPQHGATSISLRVNYPQAQRKTLDRVYAAVFAGAFAELAHAADLAARAADERGALAAGMLETAAAAAVAVGRHGRVIAANAAAEALFADGALFVDRMGRLRCRVAADDEAVARLVAAAVVQEPAPGIVRIREFGATGDILASFIPVGLEGRAGPSPLDFGSPAAVVYLACDGAAAGATVSALERLYDLPPVEARLAFAVYRGRRVASFAAVEGIGVYAASLLLERAMDRLSARRTADLVRRVAAVAALVRADHDG